MKYLIKFESYDVLSHLKERGVDKKSTRFIFDQQSGDVYLSYTIYQVRW